MWRWLGGGFALLVAVVVAWHYAGKSRLVEPAPGSAWIEPGTGMQFVWVPSGCFDMGAHDGRDSDKPVHRVCVKGFYLGKYEVTQAEYEKIVGTNPCAVQCDRYLGADRPVTNVQREDAQRMAALFSKRAGNRFRLPSEAEWEYACLAGGRHKEYCGDGSLRELAWLYGDADGPKAVGGRQPNAWGLSDMMGNVHEYVQDCWHGNYVGAPRDGSAWTKDGYCMAQLHRGGGFDTLKGITATNRFSLEADMEPVNLMSKGFRLVKML
jgi:formylglycine-generating enzyme required for sulfatase activity